MCMPRISKWQKKWKEGNHDMLYEKNYLLFSSRLIPQSHLLYGGHTVAVELQNRVIPAVAVEILRWPQGHRKSKSLCFTGRRGGRRIIARSYDFFHFYVRRRNLTRRSHAVDASTATVRRTYGGPASVSQSVASV